MSKTEYTAIVTDVHYRMSLAIIRDLAEAGVNVAAAECNHKEPPLGFYSRYVSETLLADEESYVDELYEFCLRKFRESGRKPVIITVGTATMDLFSEDVRARFSEAAGFCIPKEEHLALLNDKKRFSGFAAECGLDVPAEYPEPYDDAAYPCVVKPLCGEKYGIKAWDRYKIVNSRSELLDAAESFKKLCGGEAPVVQQYISGQGFGCEFFAYNGEVLSILCHERIREYPVSGGPSACCRSVHIPELEDCARAVCRKLGFSGPAMLEFKRGADGKFYILECNPRVWGTYPLTRASKSNLSLCWFKTAFEAANPGCIFEIAQNDYRDVRMHFALSDVAAGLGYLRHGKPGKGLAGVFSWLDPFIKNGLFELKDPKPALVYLKNRL